MTLFEATMLCEGHHDLAGYDEDEVDEELMLQAWQLLVDSGLAWSLQGSFGRTAMYLIERGMISMTGGARVH